MYVCVSRKRRVSRRSQDVPSESPGFILTDANFRRSRNGISRIGRMRERDRIRAWSMKKCKSESSIYTPPIATSQPREGLRSFEFQSSEFTIRGVPRYGTAPRALRKGAPSRLPREGCISSARALPIAASAWKAPAHVGLYPSACYVDNPRLYVSPHVFKHEACPRALRTHAACRALRYADV